ncbi:hypothetical protein LCGC14_0524010 [marine sediment metagenome]|uniref:DUF218 domain-containing protein n=1 Tax=marine sediment metagenome TaxID=412755 RepID=A0A0F9UIZ6_9ZZZZ|nr:YdcF family protein [Methylophaga sp.]HEC58146.1 YdcF family protein [Methylophaga sp.]
MDDIFFVVSKLAWALLSPSNLIIILMTLATIMLLVNKVSVAKWIFIPLMMVSWFVMAYPLTDSLISPLETRFSKPTLLPDKIDGIIVLGGGEKLKQSLSWHTAELGDAGDRFIGAAVLAKHYPQAPIIYSGGSNLLQYQNGQDDINIARTILTAVGITEERLIIESKSRNTAENFQFLKPKLPTVNGTYLLVTSAYHMPRSVGIARQQSINVIPYPVDYMSNKKPFQQWDFDFIGHLEILDVAWHEWLGLTVYYWTNKTAQWFPQEMAEHNNSE